MLASARVARCYFLPKMYVSCDKNNILSKIINFNIYTNYKSVNIPKNLDIILKLEVIVTTMYKCTVPSMGNGLLPVFKHRVDRFIA